MRCKLKLKTKKKNFFFMQYPRDRFFIIYTCPIFRLLNQTKILCVVNEKLLLIIIIRL